MLLQPPCSPSRRLSLSCSHLTPQWVSVSEHSGPATKQRLHETSLSLSETSFSLRRLHLSDADPVVRFPFHAGFDIPRPSGAGNWANDATHRPLRRRKPTPRCRGHRPDVPLGWSNPRRDHGTYGLAVARIGDVAPSQRAHRKRAAHLTLSRPGSSSFSGRPPRPLDFLQRHQDRAFASNIARIALTFSAPLR
jgi:hypothetical protein